jgi:hypothetical protein
MTYHPALSATIKETVLCPARIVGLTSTFSDNLRADCTLTLLNLLKKLARVVKLNIAQLLFYEKVAIQITLLKYRNFRKSN